MTTQTVDVQADREMVRLVVTTTETRKEVEVPVSVLADMQALTRHLSERDIPVPPAPMLTESETGYVLHETPSFG